MNRRNFLVSTVALTATAFVFPMTAISFPTVFPHGTTIYKPEKCWNGYTVFGTEVEAEGMELLEKEPFNAKARAYDIVLNASGP